MKEKIIEVLKEIFDPEIPVNVYDLGLIYDININEDQEVVIVMTLTAPNCPMADDLLAEVKEKVSAIDGVKDAIIDLTFEPPWDDSKLSDEALLDLGLL
jgi:FeS assembly SUF system protein